MKWDVKMGFWFWMDAEGHAVMGQAGTCVRVPALPDCQADAQGLGTCL